MNKVSKKILGVLFCMVPFMGMAEEWNSLDHCNAFVQERCNKFLGVTAAQPVPLTAWNCHYCGQNNHAVAKYCKACGKRRPKEKGLQVVERPDLVFVGEGNLYYSADYGMVLQLQDAWIQIEMLDLLGDFD